MNIEVLKEYVELAINRSFTNTARALNVSHSSLSRHIAMLEKELGERLVTRTNPLELTQAGKIVLKKASAILFELEDTKRLLRENRESLRGEVRVMDLAPSFEIVSDISSALLEMRRAYPGISMVSVGPSVNKEVVEALRDRSLDIAFRYHFYREGPDGQVPDLPCGEEGLTPVRLERLRYRLCFGISETHPLYGRDEVTLADLAKHGFVQPANKFYMDSNRSFAGMCAELGLNPRMSYVETGGLYDLWLAGSSASAILFSDRIVHNQALPPGYFDRVRLVYPSDAAYGFELYAAYDESNTSEIVAVVMGYLCEGLGRPALHRAGSAADE